ncbi:MAG: PIN domain-containing protein [Rudaea sp.]
MKCFFDTNVLVYRFDTNESRKQAIATDLVDRCILDGSFRISTQVMMEFYSVTTRKLSSAVSPASAARVIAAWAKYDPVTITPSLIVEAAAIHERHYFPWWDSVIVAAAVAAGADVLYSEDFQHGRDFDGLQIVNPFRAATSVNEPRTPYSARRRR